MKRFLVVLFLRQMYWQIRRLSPRRITIVVACRVWICRRMSQPAIT